MCITHSQHIILLAKHGVSGSGLFFFWPDGRSFGMNELGGLFWFLMRMGHPPVVTIIPHQNMLVPFQIAFILPTY